MSPDRGEPSPDSPGRGARAHRRGPEPIEPGEVRLLWPRAGQPAPRPAQQWKLSLVPPPAARAGDGQARREAQGSRLLSWGGTKTTTFLGLKVGDLFGIFFEASKVTLID